MNIKLILEQLLLGKNLNPQEITQVMHACMQGSISEIQLAAFLVLMRQKGETLEELTTAVNIMQAYAQTLFLDNSLIDIVGTGGDSKNTFNVSTVSSIVAAAAGAKVAKHGNYAVSSHSGSANVLEEAGIALHLSPQALANCFNTTNICFLFAPQFHPALSHVAKTRQALGLRSFFNLLGPLLNPANPAYQIVGVFSLGWQEKIAQLLAYLGRKRVMVITSEDGMDEVSIAASTQILEYHQQQFHQWVIKPADYGCFHADLQSICVNSPQESLTVIKKVLAGQQGPAYDMVLLNSGLALYCAGVAPTFASGIDMARECILNGHAEQCFQKLITLTQRAEIHD